MKDTEYYIEFSTDRYTGQTVDEDIEEWLKERGLEVKYIHPPRKPNNVYAVINITSPEDTIAFKLTFYHRFKWKI